MVNFSKMKNGAKASTQLRFVAIALFYYFGNVCDNYLYLYDKLKAEKFNEKVRNFIFSFSGRRKRLFLPN